MINLWKMEKKYIINLLKLFAFCLLLLGYACEQKRDSKEFTISGKLQNVTDSFFIAARELPDTLVVDTVRINSKGEFSFSGRVDTMTVMSLYFNQNTKYAYILVDKGWDVSLKGDVLYADLIDVKGGSINDDLTEFKIANKTLLKTRADILYKEQDRKRDGSADLVSSRADIGELKNVEFEMANIATQYVKDNPTKISSVIVINAFFKNENFVSRLDGSLALLRGDAESFPLTTILRQYSRNVKRSAIGATAPYFRLENPDGQGAVSLYDYKGKYLLLSFSSAACDYCKAEIPDMIAVYDSLKGKDIEFVTILIDTEKEQMPKLRRDSIKWTVLPEAGSWSSKIFDDYNIHLIPAHILISPENKILERDVSIYNLPEKLSVLMGRSREKED